MALPLLAAAAATTIKIGIDIMNKKRSIDLSFNIKRRCYGVTSNSCRNNCK